MSDTFHKNVPDEFIEKMCRVMQSANWHTYQCHEAILPNAETAEWSSPLGGRNASCLVGRDAENKARTARIDHLRRQELPSGSVGRAAARIFSPIDLSGIDWVIAGGESGHGCRPMNEEWVTSVRDQCLRAGVKFFFKQWGGRNKKEAGRRLQGGPTAASRRGSKDPHPNKKERHRMIVQ